MAELKRDKAFMEQFVEFLKYEQIIVDFALKMHHIQFDLVVDNNWCPQSNAIINRKKVYHMER